ncbi:leucyl aminopeptidase [Thermomonospora echinospora]|uniref:Probable cytosol aminopeptidase n=1 Tax=Thermomonospora echinospora TaxID=1992 RepID=A0A1H6A047_9ACTN|nr:leucyl aminopeptidase family protein [Thermomonospora echinospora]SEG42143.1 leucyl aminopeptidase [Thermomonospora echinospora]
MPIHTRIRTEPDARPVGRVALDNGAELVAVPVRPGPEVHGADLGVAPPLDPADLLAFHDAKGEPGEVVACPLRLGDGTGELLLYGVGDGSPGALRRAGAALARRAKGRDGLVVLAPEGDAAAFAEGALLGSYEFWIGEAPRRRSVGTITVLGADRAAVERGTVIAEAAALARDLANTPSVDKSPAWLADRAAELAERSGLGVRIRDEGALREEGFGGLIAVGAGSVRPPRLIELTYEPEGGADRHLVLVGKGITFDSGGLSLKPNDNMKTMKTDMAAGGVVMAVLAALPALGVRARVTGLVAAAENMPSGSAMRPSDVITHYGGRTSEVLNTDAEGRLVLADALAYADAVLEPDAVVDVATLTGAAKVALGLRHAALFATDDALAEGLTGAGTAAGEPVWRMPLVDDYRVAIESEVADVANIERRGFGGGAIMAALFLREFAGKRPWAHLDVAGPGRATADDAEITKGATGYGARLLLNWLIAQN